MAEAARSKHIPKQYETREMDAGLKVIKSDFKTIGDLIDWYRDLSSVSNLKDPYRKLNACNHLLVYFKDKKLNQAEGEDQEQYREFRKKEVLPMGPLIMR